MAQYLIICIILLLLNLAGSLLSKELKDKHITKITFWLQVVLLMSLSMFRDFSVGKDTLNYVEFYQSSTFEFSRFEPGFIYLVRFCKKISSNPRFFLCITSIFIFYSFGKTIWRYSKMPSLSLYIIYCYTFFNFALSGLRESLAISIILLSFPYILKRDYLKFIILLALASSMHTTACIFIFAPLLAKLRISKRNILLLLMMAILLQSLFNALLNYALLIVPAYNSYVVGGVYFGDTRLASILDLGVLLSILIFCLHYYKKTLIGEIDNTLIMLVCFAIVVMIISLKFNLLSRVALYYSFFISILLPNALRRSAGMTRIFLSSTIIVIFTLYNIIILLFRPEWNATFPYKFCFL